MQERVYLLTFAATLMFTNGCRQPEEKPSVDPSPSSQTALAPAPPSDPSQEAKTIFSTRCAACHGPLGRGDGAGAAALEPKPRAFNDPEWQKSVDNDYLKKIIVEGGAAVEKAVSMPGNPDLQSKPEVVAELIKHIRSFAP